MINILIGFSSGIISGMGIGGGAILIPLITIFESLNQQTAQGVNLTYFIPTAIIATIVHIKNKNIVTKTAVTLGISGLPGAIIGSLLATAIQGDTLRRMFGFFLLLVGIYEIYKGFRQSHR
ncbi:MAG: sulfite exporter TauE/SafE family protein [Clostridia bacterium]|nr:sulfite exporter TauE/SafE family protein [Clostridia bacterium]